MQREAGGRRKLKRVLVMLASLTIATTTLTALEFVRVSPTTTFGSDPRDSLVQLVASDPPAAAPRGYLLNATQSTTPAPYNSSWSVALGNWPKDAGGRDGVRVFPAAFGIFNAEAGTKLRILKVELPGLSTGLAGCVNIYLHKNPRLLSNAGAAGAVGLTSTSLESSSDTKIYFQASNTSAWDRSGTGWVLNNGTGYTGSPASGLDYDNNAAGARDTATYDSSRRVWVRAVKESATGGGVATGLLTTSSSTSNFVWVDITVDTRASGCTGGAFGAANIMVYARSV